MNKKKRIIVILGILCLALIAYALVINLTGESEDDSEEIVLSSLNPEDVISYSYKHYDDAEYGDELYTFVKENGAWYYEADRDFPVSQFMATSKVNSVCEITAKRVVEEKPEDIAQYGLDTPYLTVSVSDSADTYTYHVGDYNSSTLTYYVMQEGNDTVYLADAQLFLAFDVQLWDMIEKEDIPEIDEEALKQISFKFPEEEIVLKKAKLEKDYVKSEWYLLDENSEIMENTNKIVTEQSAKLVNTLSYLREVDYKCEESEYSLYGFNNPSLVISLVYDNGGTEDELIFTIGTQTAENHIYEDYYIISNKSEAVLTINYEILEALVAIDKNSMISE